MGTLYLVATPIGNLEDLTYRAARVLGEVVLIAAEDTRTTRRLLARYQIENRVVSYNEHNAARRTAQILDALANGDVAMVSEAGTPGISDPGYQLAVAAIAAGHEVSPLPGASAVVAAVAASGLPARRFHYLGFLPRTSARRRQALRDAAASGDTLVFFESPHRLRATLADALAALGDRRVAICRELTKLHEEIWRGTLGDAMERFAAPRGEFTIVVERGAAPAEQAAGGVEATVAELRANHASSREAIAEIVRRHGLPRREAYRVWHSEGRDRHAATKTTRRIRPIDVAR
jgi:16S rRNA (cytidine1402-2'-O)-methyltransferase